MAIISEGSLLIECRKLIARQERYMRDMRKDDDRRRRRGTRQATAVLRSPSYWTVDPAFDPYHVRRNAESIARAVNRALAAGDYQPLAPIAHEVPKTDGTTRVVSIFPIADSVVSRAVYLSLLAKNRALLSAHSYAYRSDVSAHDAIQYIASEFAGIERIFIAEYDFSKYFDSISHEHLWSTLRERNFLSTGEERAILRAFVRLPLQSESAYVSRPPLRGDPRGIPQGTSVSLFLANVAAWEMDRRLERIGVGFARYADDTLIWSRDYAQICEAANVLRLSSSEIGAALNPRKSKGVRLFVSPGEPAEIEHTSTVEFVGYRFRSGQTGFRDVVVDRMKRRVRYLVWANLLQPLQEGGFRPARVAPPVDRDYLVLLMQLRRYFYGNLTESRVRELERGAVRRIRFPGVLAYFPLVDDEAQLAEIDGWMLSTIEQAMAKRRRMLAASGLSAPHPHGLAGMALAKATGKSSSGHPLDLRVPSVARFSSVLRRAAAAYGANAVGRGTGLEQYQYGTDQVVRS